MLDTPDSAFAGWWGGGWPWGELFGDGAEVWPGAGSGEGCCFCGGGAVVGDFFGGEEVADYDEAVALEGFEVHFVLFCFEVYLKWQVLDT